MSKNFLIYSASAGSGKTYTLVLEYLAKILSTEGNFSQILAITFTNKATAEMKARIVSELDILSKGHPSKYLQNLIIRINEDENRIRNKAAVQLKKILHDYSSFSVSTIDSYFQVLARTLTRELKIPVRYEIELNENRIRQETATRLLARAGVDRELTEWLMDLLIDKLDQGKGWKILPDLRVMTGEVINRDEARQLSLTADRNVIRQLLKELLSIRDGLESTLSSIGTTAIKEILNAGVLITDFSNGDGGAAGYFRKITSKDPKKWIPGKRVMDAIDDPSKFLRKDDRKNDSLRSLTEEVIHPLLCQAYDEYNAGIKDYNSAIAVIKLLYYTGIFPVIGEELKNIRDEYNVFLLSDTTRLLKLNIAGQDAPFVFEKSGIRYKHVYIDEFQDTGTEQWEILLPLALNTLGNGNQLLLVGDAKQSIYRWRGGNMHLIRKDAANSLSMFKASLEQKVLNTNYRSAETIVNFNNLFFPSFAKALRNQYIDFTTDEIVETFSPAEVSQHFTDKMKGKGYVDFSFFKSASSKSDSESDESEEHEKAKWKDLALDKMKSVIDELVSSGYKLKEIAILFRKNDEEHEIASYLLQHTQYPFISNNSLQLESDLSVRFLLNCLYILNGNEEQIHRIEAEEFLLKHKLQVKRDGLPFQLFDKLEDGTWFNDVLVPLKAKGKTYPVNLLVAIIREKCNLLQAHPFLDAFEDKLNEFIAKQSGGLNEFLNWWEEQSEKTEKFCLDMPESENAIRMLSIHRSKGLEFDVVIIPFCEWAVLPDHKTRLWAQGKVHPYNLIDYLPVSVSGNLSNSVFREDYLTECNESVADNLNLTYVAFTRPKERLYVFSTASKGKLSVSILEAIKETGLFELQTDEHSITCTLGIQQVYIPETSTLEIESLYNPPSVNSKQIPVKAGLTHPVLVGEPSTREIKTGNALHDIIAFTLTADDLQDRIQRASINHGLSVSELEPVANRIMSQLKENGWLSPHWKVFAETDFCDAEGNVFRPDRVLRSDTETVVLDFKTGAPDPKYSEQVNEYCKLLESIGFPSISGYLVYPASNVIQPVG